MDYVGIDYCVDLACSSCNKTTRIRYSRLIGLVADRQSVQCAACGRATNHDWTTALKSEAPVPRTLRHGATEGAGSLRVAFAAECLQS